MNKGDLIERVRSTGDLTRGQAESVVDAVLDSVKGAVRSGERVSLAGFGSFNPSSRAARTGRNPQTGQPVKIAAAKSVRFAPASAFKHALNPGAARKKAAAAKKAAAGKAPAKKAGLKKAAAKKAGKFTSKR